MTGRSPAHIWRNAARCSSSSPWAKGSSSPAANSPNPAAGWPSILAFITAFVSSFALWWVYFDLGARRGAEHIEHHADPGRVARNAFTYWHLPIVGGIVVLAVVDEQALAHPLAPSHPNFVALTGAGSLLFLGGTMVFKRLTSGRHGCPPRIITACGSPGWWRCWAGWRSRRICCWRISQTLVFVIVAVWEWGSFHGGWIDRVERHLGPLGRALKRRSDACAARKHVAQGWKPPRLAGKPLHPGAMRMGLGKLHPLRAAARPVFHHQLMREGLPVGFQPHPGQRALRGGRAPPPPPSSR